MNVLEVIKNRRTIQSFLNEEIPEAKIRTAIEAAIAAPNHKLTFPWLFVWVEKSTRAKLAEIQAELKGRKKTLSSVERDAVVRNFMEPAVLLVAAIKKCDDANQAEEDYAAMACAIQNLSLYLCAEGIGSKWGTGGVIRDSRTHEILRLPANDYKLCGLVWVGKARVVPKEPKRPPVDQFLVKR